MLKNNKVHEKSQTSNLKPQKKMLPLQPVNMFRIKKLDIFITKQFGLLFVGTFFICLFVLMMQFLWRYVDELIGKGLSLEVLAQFFWYMGLGLMPQAFPLAILLSSLITYGNLGESSELTAIKAAGISLMQSMRSLIVITCLIAGISFFFQNVVVPKANIQFSQLLLSMKQKSPELEIPEGIFYDGIPGSNLYVEKKDLETGHLYGIMIYRQSNSYEDQTIILADSGMLQSTAEKKHLLLTLWSGEWFENMRQQDMGGTAEVPYRRETFAHKTILLDFDGDFNLADVAGITSDAKAKDLNRILTDLDSIKQSNDSVGRQFYKEACNYTLFAHELTPDDSARLQTVKAEEMPSVSSRWPCRASSSSLSALRLVPSSARVDWVCLSSSRYWYSSSITSSRTLACAWRAMTTGRCGLARVSRQWYWRRWLSSSPTRPTATQRYSTSTPISCS